MDDSWDVLADGENTELKFKLSLQSNKWEGEDEDEDVKDSWEDDEEEKKEVEKPVEAPKAKAKPKKALAERIEEREKKAREEAERKAKEKEEALPPEERRAEQLRRQRLQEEADLRLAMETFGVAEDPVCSPENFMPSTKDEFDQYLATLTGKLSLLAKSAEFPTFGEDLIKVVALNLPTAHLKKVKILIDGLITEKQKNEKTKKAKSKNKAKLKIEGDNTLLTEYDDYYHELDDFM